MKVNAHLDTNKLSEISEQAARAEALGFDSLALAELTLDPFLCPPSWPRSTPETPASRPPSPSPFPAAP